MISYSLLFCLSGLILNIDIPKPVLWVSCCVVTLLDLSNLLYFLITSKNLVILIPIIVFVFDGLLDTVQLMKDNLDELFFNNKED